MDEDAIWTWLKNDPDKFFDLCESHNIDFRGMKELDIPKLFVRKRYKDKFTQEGFDAGEAVLWLAYFAEREISEDILAIETELGKDSEHTQEMIDEMDFGQKLSFVERNYSTEGKSDKYINVLREIKALRNHMAHGRLHMLRYGKYSMADPRGQMKLTLDLMNAALRK